VPITLADLQATITDFLVRAKKPTDDLSPDRSLYGGGLGLDSLEAAELSVVLEDTYGSDPFTESERMPQVVGDILAFYGLAPATA
jgi:acyl carrier protein